MRYSSFAFSDISGSNPIVPVPNDRLVYLNANVSGAFTPPGPVNSYWYDQSGNNYDFIISGSYEPTRVTGSIPSYVDYPANVDAYYYGNVTGFSVNEFSYGGWVNIGELPNVNIDYNWTFTYVKNAVGPTPGSLSIFAERGASPAIQGFLAFGSFTGGTDYVGALSYPGGFQGQDFWMEWNKWFYVTYTFKNTALQGPNIFFYINGKLLEQNSETGPVIGNKEWFIGVPLSFFGNQSNMKISTFEIWNRQLSREEVFAAFNATKGFYGYFPTVTPTPTPTVTPTPTPTPSPTPTVTPIPVSGITYSGLTIYVNSTNASYPGTGTTWTSIATGTTYNGTLVNGPVWNGGINPSYFAFDGTNDHVTYPYTGSTTGSFTWGGWVYTTTSATEKVFYMRGRDGSGSGWSAFVVKDPSNKIKTGVVTTSPSLSQTDAVSTTTLVSNTWYYVMGVWNAGVSVKIYVNGVLETTTNTTRTNLRTSTVGWINFRGNGTSYTNGRCGEFELYDRVLSDAEILANYNGTKATYGF